MKAPDHLSVNLTGLHTLLAEERFTGSGLHFGKADPGRPEATHVSLQWGDRWYASSFQWQDGRYHCFHLKLPYKTYLDKTGLEETQLAFENVVVQHVAYDYGAANWLPFLRDVGEGKAELFIAGCVTEGSWRKESPDAPTRFYDAEGCEALLTPGQTYIALLPEQSGTVTW